MARRNAVLFFALGIGVSIALARWLGPFGPPASPAPPPLLALPELPDTAPPKALSARMEQVAEAIRPSVVSVRVLQAGRDPLEDLFPGSRFRRGGVLVQGQGSGVIFDAKGLVVTNFHVVKNATAIVAGLSDGRTLPASEVVGTDPMTDLAVFRIPAKDLVPIRMGDSERVRPGQIVLAIGSPFGLDQTVTQGIVSAKGRSLDVAEDVEFLQTDAAINGGNSGGALVDLDGRLVGINTAILSGGGGFQGVGFAIPVNTVQDVVDQLLSNGRVSRGAIGIVMRELVPAERERERIQGGVRLVRVLPGSPAERAGVQAGDIALRFDGKDVQDGRHFRRLISFAGRDDEKELIVLRKGTRKTLKVQVAKVTGED